MTLHLRLFATMQQLNLVSSKKLLPNPRYFIPFTQTSPFARPPPLALNFTSFLGLGTSLVRSVAPFAVIIAHGKLKYLISRIVYRPIYKALPRPTGDSMFSGLSVPPPSTEYDAPDREGRVEQRTQDDFTLRALEGLPSFERIEAPPQPREAGREAREGSDDEEGEMQPTIISFDVEAAENVEPALGTWSAELRNTNEIKASGDVSYRVTGLTLLPTIMATEGLREVVTALVTMPSEAVMIRLIGRGYRKAVGLAVDDMWGFAPVFRTLSFSNLLPVLGIQVVVTGVVWAGFTLATHIWSIQRRALMEADAKVREEQMRDS